MRLIGWFKISLFRMRIFDKLKITFRIFLLISGGLLVLSLFINLNSPRYIFPKPAPFSGKSFYNPYQDMDSSRWLKGNFQVQSRVWLGLTSGRNNSSDDVRSIYRQLGYDVLCFSDYQQINHTDDTASSYIPAYEHGYGPHKRHQIGIGSRKVLWLDYLLWQNLGNKQHIINRLRPDNDLIAIAHPNLKGGYAPSDFRYLTGYDLIEALNHIATSVPHWDSALSAGKPAFILADDDAHDIKNPHFVGRFCTFIKAPSAKQPDVVQALKAGKAFGAMIYMKEEDGFPEKIDYAAKMPVLKSAQMAGDTFTVEVSEAAKEISFIGQGGTIKRTATVVNKASYVFKPEDTYIRAEILFPNIWNGSGTHYYLNPVFRYSGGILPKNPLAFVDKTGTLINRVVAYATLIFFILVTYLLRKKLFYFRRKIQL